MGQNHSTKRALLVGCNYPQCPSRLHGCVQDVALWKDLLTECLGFKSRDIVTLVDEGESEQPTRTNIRRHLERLVSTSRSGDVVFFHFSGFGAQIPAISGSDERDNLDEVLCPTDVSLIVDDELREIISTLPGDVQFTMVADCGHSGTMLDGQDVVLPAAEEELDSSTGKALFQEITALQFLKSQGQASLVAHRSLDAGSIVGMRAQSMRKESVEIGEASFASRRSLTRAKSDIPNVERGILVAACAEAESAAEIRGPGGTAHGVLTYVLVHLIRHLCQKKPLQRPTYTILVSQVRQLLHYLDFKQSVRLECSPAVADQTFAVAPN